MGRRSNREAAQEVKGEQTTEVVNIFHQGGESSLKGFHGPKELLVVQGVRGVEVEDEHVDKVDRVRVLGMPT